MTVRTLVILRHAKAANPEGMADVDRPLTQRGHADAAAAGLWLTQSGYVPDLVLCSTALRTRQTWHGVSVALPTEPPVRFELTMYSASAVWLLELIRSLDDSVATVLVVGHNPGLSQLVAELDPDRADVEGLHTAGIAVHSWEGAWTACHQRLAPLVAAHTARA